MTWYLLMVVGLVPVAEEVGRRSVLAVVVEAPRRRRRTCSYEDGDGLLGGCRDTRGSPAGCLFQAPILACRSRSCQRRMSSQLGKVSTGKKEFTRQWHLTRRPHGRRRGRRGLSLAASHCLVMKVEVVVVMVVARWSEV